MNLGKTPMPIEASPDKPVVVTNYAGDTAYYKTTVPVATSDTSIAVGSAVTFTNNAYLISGGTSVVYARELSRPSYDTITVAALTGLNDATFVNNTAAAAHNKSIFYDGTTLVFRISASTVTADLY